MIEEKVLVVGDFKARVGTNENVKVDDNIMLSHSTRDLEDCIMSDYGRLLLRMFNCKNKIFSMVPMISDEKCFGMYPNFTRRYS